MPDLSPAPRQYVIIARFRDGFSSYVPSIPTVAPVVDPRYARKFATLADAGEFIAGHPKLFGPWTSKAIVSAEEYREQA